MRIQLAGVGHAALPDEHRLQGSPMLFSGILHSVILAAAVLPVAWIRTEVPWGSDGSGGSAIAVNLVSAIPLPPAEIENPLATDEKTANPPVPEIEKRVDPRPSDKVVDVLEKKRRERLAEWEKRMMEQELKARKDIADNSLPGRGGRASLPDMYNIPTTQGAGGIGFGGDFGTRYGWYVTQVRTCIARQWDRSRVEGGARMGSKVFVNFEILRDGTILNEKLAATSGNVTLDREGLRAVFGCSGRSGSDAKLPPLPSDFSGRSVPVEVWFEFK